MVGQLPALLWVSALLVAPIPWKASVLPVPEGVKTGESPSASAPAFHLCVSPVAGPQGPFIHPCLLPPPCILVSLSCRSVTLFVSIYASLYVVICMSVPRVPPLPSHSLSVVSPCLDAPASSHLSLTHTSSGVICWADLLTPRYSVGSPLTNPLSSSLTPALSWHDGQEQPRRQRWPPC